MLSDYDGDPSALAKEVGPVDGSIPVLITRNLIPFPGVMTPILIGRQPSLKLLDYLRDHPDQTFAVFAQKDASVDYPIQEDLFEVGVYAKLVKEFEVPGSNNEHSAIVIASARCRLKSLDDANNFFTAETEMIPEVFPAEDDKEFAAAVEGLRQGVEIYVKMNDDIPNEAMVALQNISNHLSIVNFVASNIVSNIYDKIMLLEEDNMKLRLFKLLKVLNRETQFLHIKKNIQNKTRADIDEQQKEYFLHQQIKNIREELGDSGESEDKRELKKKAFLKPWPDEVSKLFAKELAKLDNINPQSPDYSVLLNYLQTLVSLPWGVYTKDRLDLKRAQRVLDRNHYGMEKVKERILEYMAVLRLRGDLKSPILCLYGPPGVGKTSLGKSVAEAMGRKYVRVSLGGLHDEAEVRGHRRTYIGAMPGRIMTALIQAKSKNALLLQKIQLRQKRLYIFLNLLRLKGIAVKAAVGAAQIAERNMQIQRRRLRRLQSKLLQHRPGHHPRQRFGLARNIGQIFEACFNSSCPRLAGKSLIIITLIKGLDIFYIINHQPTPLLHQDTF